MEIYIFVNVFCGVPKPQILEGFLLLAFLSEPAHWSFFFFNFFDKCLQKMKMSPEPLASSEAETVLPCSSSRKEGILF